MKLCIVTFLIFFFISCKTKNVIIELSKIDNSQKAEITIDSLRIIPGFVLDTVKINSQTRNFNLRPITVDSFLVKNNDGIVFEIFKDNPVENTVSLFIVGTVQDTLVNLYYNEYGQGSWHWKLNKIEYFQIDSSYIKINTIIEPIEFALSFYIDFCCNENGGYGGIKENMRLQIYSYN